MKKKSSNFITVLLVLILLVGLSLLLYPSVSDYWNSFHQSKAITEYAKQVATLDEDQYGELWEAAADYNASLMGRSNNYLLNEVWGSPAASDTPSLRVFMATLRKKIEEDPSHPRYIQTHIGVGYRMIRQ